MSDERNPDETIEISATYDYTEEELNQIKEALTELGYNTERKRYHRLSTFPLPLPPALILTFATMSIAMEFLRRLGSDLYDYTKKKIIETFFKPRKNEKSKVFFELKIDDIKINTSCQYETKKGLNLFFKSLIDVYESIEDQFRHQELPENLKQIFIEFDGEGRTWQITGHQTSLPPVEFDVDSEEWKPIK
ncbi:MAG: hypothetical protein PHD13_05665 [Methanocellales archaeon]|nr:hypothetical protein [Methanocellales archaeon]MDD3291957.1 hypothetical protein [Methanocellales archaeon]MDD5235642.1 hypothetical protein [Methanocellales archaeon]MDD5485489.1 hypothetical protein [Methanocellales archaeon]